jgi:flagellar biosynthesis protein FlhB
MAEHRPFPPSPRRRALARRAGLHAASPLFAGAAAAAAAVVALGAIGRTLADRLAAAVAAACRGRPALPPGAVLDAVVGVALPLAGAAALAALAVHIAQVRGVWLPRRRIPGAPAGEAGPGPRTRRAAFELAAAATIGGVALAWLWLSAPRIAVLAELAPTAVAAPSAASVAPPLAPPGVASPGLSQLLAGTAALLAGLAAALVVAWVVYGILDAVLRHAALGRALAMTPAEQREDTRLASADPRWRAHRNAVRREPGAAEAVAGASLLVLGDNAAVAIAWHAVLRPIPVRSVAGLGPRATQLLGLARRHRIPVHRDPALAAALVGGDGPVPEPHWPRVAELIAATRGRARVSQR